MIITPRDGYAAYFGWEGLFLGRPTTIGLFNRWNFGWGKFLDTDLDGYKTVNWNLGWLGYVTHME
jgi:hypothetical protein